MKNFSRKFILIEMVISFFLFAVLSSMFVMVTQKKQELLSTTKTHLIAVQTAESKLEEIRSVPFEKILSLHKTFFDVPGLKSASLQPPGYILVEAESPKLLKIQVKIFWSLTSQNPSAFYSLVTWVGEGGLFYATQ
ncbi:MAG: hypothetical protein AABZ60_06860 [Planctomycetota bacterium]